MLCTHRLLCVAFASVLCVCDGTYIPMDNHWTGGFTGKVTLTARSEVNDWTVHLIFNQPVLDLQIPQASGIQQVSDREFVLRSQTWDAHINSGGHLTLEIVGRVSGNRDISSITACAYFELNGNDCYPVTTTSSTTPATTTPPSTTTAKTTSPTPTITLTATTKISTMATLTTLSSPVTQSTPPAAVTTRNATAFVPADPSTTSASAATSASESTSTGMPLTSTSSPTTTIRATTPTTPVPRLAFGQPTKDYEEALRLSLLFYYAQRSGQLPADNPVPWRNDSALTDCVTGGWYDDGGHIKSTFLLSTSLTTLLWGVDRFQDGYRAAGQLDTMYDTVRWGLDYLLEAWDPFTQQLVVQIGDPQSDHDYWGRPEDMTMSRDCIRIGPQRPGSDVAAQTSAALAAGAVVFKRMGDIQYARTLLQVAESMYDFATLYRERYSDNSPSADYLEYVSTSVKDELCQAGVWLYRATGDEDYLTDAKFEFTATVEMDFSWDDKMVACQLLLYEATADDKYKTRVENFLQSWQPGGQVQYTPCGLALRERTHLPPSTHVGNVAFLALLASQDGMGRGMYNKWAVEQLNYLLGDNPHDDGCFSYQIGYGNKYPTHPHHRASSCPDPPAPCSETNLHAPLANPHVLSGGLVGGPTLSDSYTDTRTDDTHNQPDIIGNAGFQSALAGLIHLASTGRLPKADTRCPCTS